MSWFRVGHRNLPEELEKKEELEDLEDLSQKKEQPLKDPQTPTEKKVESSKEEEKEKEKDSVQSPFGHPELKGMTEEEIAEKLRTLSVTVKEQQGVLGEAHKRLNTPAPVEEKEEEISAQDFWNDPASNIKKLIKSELKSTIAPLQANLSASRFSAEEEIVAKKFSDYGELKPIVDSLITRYNFQNPDAGMLEHLYFTAKGMQTAAGGNIPKPDSKKEPEKEVVRDTRPVPPQHRPSSHPMADTGRKEELRDLTEAEEEVRRAQGLTKEEYLKLQEADEEDFLAVKGS